MMPAKLFPTTLVGSYPQPDWLIDRQKLARKMPARIRAQELWRVAPEWLEQARTTPRFWPFEIRSALVSISSLTVRCGGRAIQTVLQPRSKESIWKILGRW